MSRVYIYGHAVAEPSVQYVGDVVPRHIVVQNCLLHLETPDDPVSLCSDLSRPPVRERDQILSMTAHNLEVSAAMTTAQEYLEGVRISAIRQIDAR